MSACIYSSYVFGVLGSLAYTLIGGAAAGTKGLGYFQQDSKWPVLFFKTAGFNRSPTPPLEIIQLGASFLETFQPSRHPICRSMRTL